jgi:hypothetical protein
VDLPDSTHLRAADRAPIAALVVAVGLGAFLLFQVQFVLAKWLLPWFGGAASVWTTCMLFFQTGLLLGYAYSHKLAIRFGPRKQGTVHVGLLALAIAALATTALAWPSPVTPGLEWHPSAASDPIGRLLLILTLSVGLPYFVLSTTGPLLQVWFARLRPGASPYRLYALSNAGSLLGVLLYPFAVEPLLPVVTQGWVWSALFALFAGLVAVAARAQRARPDLVSQELTREPEEGSTSSPAFWWTLSATTSLGLLAVTNQLALDIAVVPFLWMLPLVIYLGTFIWAFDAPGRFPRRVWGPLLIACSAASVFTLYGGSSRSLAVQISAHLAFLFALCATAHGELARRKPGPARLTSFYLALAGGGAIGAFVAAILAPLVFNDLWELPIALYSGLLLLAAASVQERRGWLFATARRGRTSVVSIGFLLFFAALALSALRGAKHPWVLASSRNFYGLIQVVRSVVPGTAPVETCLQLTHGQIVHGTQIERPEARMLPTTYFGPLSGVGRLLESRRAGPPLRVGVVGLGIGTLAAWGRPGDLYRFYELNPAVIRLSSPPEPRFTFLVGSRARVETVPGDARLSLAAERNQEYDVLVLDAFSSDAIPVHLLTLEAFDVYGRHLRGDSSTLAVHVSNLMLDLEPVVRGAAARRGLATVTITDQGSLPGTLASKWVLAAKDPMALSAPEIVRAAHARPAVPTGRLPHWTDAYSNLLLSLSIFSAR